MKRSQFTLRSLIVVFVVIAALTALLLPSITRTLRANHIAVCATNLRQLWVESLLYAAQNRQPDAVITESTGSEFFLRTQRGPRTITITGRYDHFFCPLAEDEPGPGRTSYRGPAGGVSISRYPDESPVAADKDGNHGRGHGGNVLTCLGDVKEVSESDLLWLRARTTTKE